MIKIETAMIPPMISTIVSVLSPVLFGVASVVVEGIGWIGGVAPACKGVWIMDRNWDPMSSPDMLFIL